MDHPFGVLDTGINNANTDFIENARDVRDRHEDLMAVSLPAEIKGWLGSGRGLSGGGGVGCMGMEIKVSCTERSV